MKNLSLISSLLAVCSFAAAQTNPAPNRIERTRLRPRASSAAATQLYVSFTQAGTAGAPGYTGDSGPATQADLNGPLSIAVDAQGDVYFYDSQNNVIREVVAATGIIKTVVGTGTPGFSGDGQLATAAQFEAAQGLAVDAAGNLYIADGPNARVRMVSTAGIISTIAGNGTFGDAGDGGPAVNAALYYPVGVTVDTRGNVFIADFGSSTVRKITAATGIITTVAGIDSPGLQNFLGDGGPATQAYLGEPYAVAVDESGNLFILDTASSSIREVGTNGIINTLVSNVSSAGLAADSAGNLYFADYRNNVVNKVLPGGTVIPIAGISGTPGFYGDGGPAFVAQYNEPYGVALDPSANIFVADYGNDAIRELYPVSVSNIVVANGASDIAYNAPGVPLALAPGEIVTIFGNNVGFTAQATAQPDANGIFEKNFASTTVTFNGIPAPILISGPTYVSAIVPYELSGSGPRQVNVVVTQFGQTTGAATIPYDDSSAPGIFTATSTGILNGLPPINASGGANPENAATVGAGITFYLTGEGQTSPAGVDGLVTGSSNPPVPLLPVSVVIDGLPATVTSVTEAPGQVAGVLQVTATVPTGTTTTNLVPVQIAVGNGSTQFIYIAVQ